MNIAVLREFFKWCTILNGGLLIGSSLLIRFAGDWVFAVHSSWIPITADAYPVAIYMLIGLFKIIVIVFNLVPYVALVMIGRNQPSRLSDKPTLAR